MDFANLRRRGGREGCIQRTPRKKMRSVILQRHTPPERACTMLQDIGFEWKMKKFFLKHE
jgi:hypothetical protein